MLWLPFVLRRESKKPRNYYLHIHHYKLLWSSNVLLQQRKYVQTETKSVISGFMCLCVRKNEFSQKNPTKKVFFALYTSFQFSDELFIFSAKWRKVFLLVVCGLQSFLYTSTCVEVHTDLNGIWVAASFVCLTTAAITY